MTCVVTRARFRSSYYIDLQPFFRSVARGAYGPLDADGLPMVDHGGRIGLRYNSTTLALYALATFQRYVQGGSADEVQLAAFRKAVDSLVQRSVTVKEKTYWYFDFDWLGGLKAPFSSGMTQALCLSALTRAYLTMENPHYLELARGAANAIVETVDKGGALVVDDSGTWIEEFPIRPPPHVLNGFLYAIFGLLDGEQVLESGDSDVVLKACISTLKRNLHRYDLGFWTRYDLQSRLPCSPKYHLLHINQMEAMYDVTQQGIFREFAIRWKKFNSSRPDKLVSEVLYFGGSSIRFLKNFGVIEGAKTGKAALTLFFKKEM